MFTPKGEAVAVTVPMFSIVLLKSPSVTVWLPLQVIQAPGTRVATGCATATVLVAVDMVHKRLAATVARELATVTAFRVIPPLFITSIVNTRTSPAEQAADASLTCGDHAFSLWLLHIGKLAISGHCTQLLDIQRRTVVSRYNIVLLVCRRQLSGRVLTVQLH